MTFVYPFLLGGLLLAGLPVLLHFLIRKKPTTLLFPAFRFLMQKRRTNTRNLRLRHLLLLLLRVVLIVLVCFALARPRVLHETIGLSREKPVALVLIFDTSLSMEYKSGEQTRLDLAKRRCLELLDQLPEDGRVLIFDTSDPSAFAREDWLKSMEKARQRVQALTTRPTSSPVNRAMDLAQRRFDALDKSGDDPLAAEMPRFICVFSDRTRASWESGALVKRGDKVQTLYFDVGIDEPVDLAITAAELPADRQSFTEGEKIPLRVGIKAVGTNPGTSNVVLVQLGAKKIEQSFHLEQSAVTLGIDSAALALGPGLHQAEVKLATDKDALSFNNVRHVTFAIQAPQRVLVLTDDVKKADSFALTLKALHYSIEVQAVDAKIDALNQYEAIFLHGMAAPDDKLWTALESFVQQGGGLGIVSPGDELRHDAYNSAAARKVMPARIGEKATGKDAAWVVGAEALEHPFLRRFQTWFVDFEFASRRAYSYWSVTPRDERDVVIRYSDGSPAVLERALPNSAGKVLLLTTPLQEQTAWNNYYSNLHWFYPGFALLCAKHLCKDPEIARYNYEFGAEPPVMAKPQAFQKYLLSSGASSEEIRFEGKWVGDRLPRAGSYVISGSNPGETKALYKFSINVPAAESDLSRVPAADIEAAFGADSLVPQDGKRLLVDTLNWDEPMELFPWLMIGLLFLLAIENLLANRFYRQDPAQET